MTNKEVVWNIPYIEWKKTISDRIIAMSNFQTRQERRLKTRSRCQRKSIRTWKFVKFKDHE